MEEKISTCKCANRGCSVVKIVGIIAIATVLGLAVVKDSIWNSDYNYNSIQIIGRGSAPVVADAAIVNFGVLTIRENTPDLAIQKTSEKLARIDMALEQAGIPKENRQITGYVLNPRYKEAPETPEGESKDPEINGYTSSQQITVLIPGIKDNANLVNEIISIATKAGANQVGEIKMVATNAEELKQKARLNALADASKKAKEMASVSGLKLKKISTLYESVLADPGSQYGRVSYYDEEMPQNQPSAPEGIIVLKPGQLDIVVELNVNYAIEE